VTCHEGFVGTVVVVCVSLGLASTARGQNPHGAPPGLAKKHTAPAGGPSGAETSGGAAGAGASTRIRSLGVWLDDATTLGPQETWLTLSTQWWGSPIGNGTDVPVFDLAAGITSNIQAFASLPYSRVNYTGLPAIGEVGTTYLGAKVQFADPQTRSIGMAVAPSLEILSDSAIDGTGLSRVNAVLPVSLEWRRDQTRVYGSTGYFTRGAWFVGGALEQTLADHWVVTGALSSAWTTDSHALAQEVDLHTTRTDISGSLSWIASPRLILFGSAARTLSTLDADSTRYAFTVGASMNLHGVGRTIPLKKP
jgi:hypothetical protein